jgi:hypothetical protein
MVPDEDPLADFDVAVVPVRAAAQASVGFHLSRNEITTGIKTPFPRERRKTNDTFNTKLG